MEFYDFHDFHDSHLEFYDFHDFRDSRIEFFDFSLNTQSNLGSYFAIKELPKSCPPQVTDPMAGIPIEYSYCCLSIPIKYLYGTKGLPSSPKLRIQESVFL